ncbi:MAG: sigma 54-interacting transcriptional regulator [Deltaproteobacteria bacterium]|nr:sigma 54-interacting transcriptional regulator [Deltaproteobacteria bacterium]
MNARIKHPTVLCIDDDPNFLEMLKKFISSRDFTALTASEGRAGLTLFRERRPDLVLVDLRMPGMDGFKVLAALTKESPDIPLIVISGEGEMDDVIKALRLGAWNYLTKPVEQFAILDYAIDEALGKAALIRENKAYQHNLENEIAEHTAKLRNTLEALQYNEKKLSAILEHFPGFICRCNAHCRIEYVNTTLARHFGREMLGEACQDTLWGIPGQCPWQGREGADLAEPYEFQHPGDKRWYRVINTLLTDDSGAMVECQLIFYDVTKDKEALLEIQARDAQLQAENAQLKISLSERYRFGEIIGKSPVMQKVYERILQAAVSAAAVIIQGESGTGKELVAKSIHQNSCRAGKPFICVNCGAIPENLIESEFFGHVKGAFTSAVRTKRGFLDLANGGTLFLGEIGEVSPAMQVKLLRALDGGGYTPVGGDLARHPDVRIVAATNRNLKEMVKSGIMREDFFFRLHVIPVEIPPLRERKEDIPLLAGHFLSQHSGDNVPVLNGRSLAALMDYHWPGNVRELQNTILRYVSIGTLDFLTPNFADGEAVAADADVLSTASYRELLQKEEKNILAWALHQHGWHQAKTATALAIDHKTLRKKIRQFGLVRS